MYILIFNSITAGADDVVHRYRRENRHTIDKFGGQGWMRSGDESVFERGTVNVDGQIQETWLLCIHDRLKELIKVSS
jgi:long-subunit acyl-CoA synthetase (AMP-forming)